MGDVVRRTQAQQPETTVRNQRMNYNPQATAQRRAGGHGGRNMMLLVLIPLPPLFCFHWLLGLRRLTNGEARLVLAMRKTTTSAHHR